MMGTAADFLFGVHLFALCVMSIYGCLGFVSIYLVWKGRSYGSKTWRIGETGALPAVTIQLPLYNEKGVANRLLRAVTDLDYPRELLQIQVLDDSDDETLDLVLERVVLLKEAGWDITHHHRQKRVGYKAGALREGLKQARNEFIAIFDADFVPPSEFLKRAVSPFEDDPRLGLVQARWAHLNASESLITRAQSVALDKHFAVEQFVRYSANYFPKFNGSAGIWRRSCLIDSGGWSAETLCEDLCLSTRAALRGWRFLFLRDLEAPAELPHQLAAYKSQQARWATGSFQCVRRYGMEILKSRDHSLAAKAYTLLTMTGYVVSGMVILLLLSLVPLVWLDFRFPPALFLFGLAGLGQTALFFFAQKTLYPDWVRRCWRIPSIVLVSMGLAPKVLVGVYRAFVGQPPPFIRTPKGAAIHYRPEIHSTVYAEVLLVLYSLAGIIGSLLRENYPPLAFLTLCLSAYGFVAFHSLCERDSKSGSAH